MAPIVDCGNDFGILHAEAANKQPINMPEDRSFARRYTLRRPNRICSFPFIAASASDLEQRLVALGFDDSARIFSNGGFHIKSLSSRRPRECGCIEIAADHDRLPRCDLIDGIEQASHLLGSQRWTAMAFEMGAHEDNSPCAHSN